jgi:hypothetical protein
MDHSDARVAVLVDCDNVNPDILEYGLLMAAQFGRVVVRRGYRPAPKGERRKVSGPNCGGCWKRKPNASDWWLRKPNTSMNVWRFA